MAGEFRERKKKKRKRDTNITTIRYCLLLLSLSF